MIEWFRNKFAWVFVRYTKGYSLIGSLMNGFNFAGIFTLLLAEPLGIRSAVLFPLIAIGGIVGMILFSVFIYDKFNLQTIINEKNGQMDDYWKHKLSPVQVKQTKMIIEALESKKKRDKIMKELEG